MKGREGKGTVIPSFPSAGANSEGRRTEETLDRRFGAEKQHSVCSEGRGQEGKPWPWACARKECEEQRTRVGR